MIRLLTRNVKSFHLRQPSDAYLDTYKARAGAVTTAVPLWS